MTYTLLQGEYKNPEIIYFDDDDSFTVVKLPDWSGLNVGEILVCRDGYLEAERGYRFSSLGRINNCDEGYYFVLNSCKEITAADII